MFKKTLVIVFLSPLFTVSAFADGNPVTCTLSTPSGTVQFTESQVRDDEASVDYQPGTLAPPISASVSVQQESSNSYILEIQSYKNSKFSFPARRTFFGRAKAKFSNLQGAYMFLSSDEGGDLTLVCR